MSDAMVWAALVVAAAGTFVIRFSFLALFSRFGAVPAPLLRALRMVPAAVLAALILPAFVRPEGSVDLSVDNLRLLAAIAAAGAALRWRNLLAPLAAGMIALWLLEWWLG